jgi:hypothetical protein
VTKWIKFAVSLAITGGCFWWTFKDVKWGPLEASLRTADYFALVPYFFILVAIHLCRTWRWGNLLAGIEKVPFKGLNEASGIGFMMLIVLPFRLGEFARPLLIAERSKIRSSAAMASVVFERIVDGLCIAVLLRGLLFFVPGETPEIVRVRLFGNGMFAVFGGGLAFLLVARWQHDRVVALMRHTVGLVAPGLVDKVVGVVDGFVGAMKQLPDAKNTAMFFVLTGAYWALNGVGMAVLAHAFDGLHEVTLFQGFVVLSVLIVGLMIPAAPGSAGTFQAFTVLGLSLFVPEAVKNSSGVAFANVLWLVQMVQQIAFGLILMVTSQSSFSKIAGKLGEAQEEAAHAKPQ